MTWMNQIPSGLNPSGQTVNRRKKTMKAMDVAAHTPNAAAPLR